MTPIQEKAKWPDEIRLIMIEKSEFYQEPKIYQYGYYDGYMKAQEEIAAKDKTIISLGMMHDDCVKEIERLKGLIELAFSEGYNYSKWPREYKSWNQFKTEHNP